VVINKYKRRQLHADAVGAAALLDVGVHACAPRPNPITSSGIVVNQWLTKSVQSFCLNSFSYIFISISLSTLKIHQFISTSNVPPTVMSFPARPHQFMSVEKQIRPCLDVVGFTSIHMC